MDYRIAPVEMTLSGLQGRFLLQALSSAVVLSLQLTLNVIQGHRNWCCAIVLTSLPIRGMIKVSHRFRDIATFTA